MKSVGASRPDLNGTLRYRVPSIRAELDLQWPFGRLSLEEQLRLIERLSQRIRENMAANTTTDEQLAAMAADPEIQLELQNIDRELATAEEDGLEKM